NLPHGASPGVWLFVVRLPAPAPQWVTVHHKATGMPRSAHRGSDCGKTTYGHTRRSASDQMLPDPARCLALCNASSPNISPAPTPSESPQARLLIAGRDDG